MRKRHQRSILAFYFFNLFLILPMFAKSQSPLNVMSFNIRFNTPRDSSNAWPLRKQFAASQIAFYEAHVIGLQEALKEQLDDLVFLNPKFKYTGRGRDDGKEAGEFSAVMYDTTRLRLLKSETFWLSETPTVPGSKSWDAAITRVVTWTQFLDMKTSKKFYFFNTHFDHIGKVARLESARILKRAIDSIAANDIAIITGDLNSKPTDDPLKLLLSNGGSRTLIDAKSLSELPHFGPTGTFNGFGPKETDDLPIDYIMLNKKLRVLKHASLSETIGGRFSSDHFPVYAQIMVK